MEYALPLLQRLLRTVSKYSSPDWPRVLEVNHGRTERHEGTRRQRTTTKHEDRVIVRSKLTVSDASVSTIRYVTEAPVIAMTLDR
ncbi:hypothetical protein TNCV_901371 [Trichonephila clavipes]|nr:hypothetical protein TNCV_901371 [Trichonephila clavipes]